MPTLSKNITFVFTHEYGKNTQAGKLTIVCRLKSCSIIFLISWNAFQVLNKTHSGTMIAAFPHILNFFMKCCRNNISVALVLIGKFA